MTNYKFINKLQDKRVLIFGGTSGIGFAVAEGALEQGATVIISGSNRAKLDKTIERLTTSYPDISPSRIITHQCDLSDEEGLDANIKALLTTVTEEGEKKLNHVVFTAGDALSMPKVSEVTVEQLRAGRAVRAIAPYILAKYLFQFLEKSPDSSFTLTGGVNTTKPIPGWTIVAAGGGQLEGLSRGLAVDMAPVRVNLVAPGAIKTELLNGLGDQVLDSFTAATLVKRIGRPEDVAEAYLYLMKDGFATGTIVESNGGRLLV